MDMALNFYSEYKRNSKELELEEPFDFFVFRPLAFLILKIANWSFLRPDHFSIVALIIAIISGYFLTTGTPKGFAYAGVGIFIFSVLDCCDGMLARMKKNGSKYGQLIDMFVDLLASICFYVGLCIGLSKGNDFFPIHYFAIVSAVFILVHASIYSFYKKQFLFYLENNPQGRTREIEKYRRDFDNLNKEGGSYFERLLIWLFLVFSRAQKNPKSMSTFKVGKYLKYNKPILPMWGVVSGSTHLMLLSLSLITQHVMLYFFYAIVLSNLWLAFVSMIQVGVNVSVDGEK
jgi:phosphatidylglycerophosphate synthase